MNMISTAENIIKFLEGKKNVETLIKRLKELNPKEFVLLYEDKGKIYLGELI